MASPTSSPQLQQQLPAAEQWRPTTVVYLLVLRGDDVQVDSWKSIAQSPWAAPGVRYTRDGLRSLLLLMGVKWRYANLTSKAVFQQVTALLPQVCLTGARKRHEMQREQQGSKWTAGVHDEQLGEVFVSMPRKEFQSLILGCLAQQGYKYSMDDLRVAGSLRERRRCLVVLLCGTSGSGKSTLASLLASRLGITTVLSTDAVRHMLRSFQSKETAPLLWASTYEAGSVLARSQAEQQINCAQPAAIAKQLHADDTGLLGSALKQGSSGGEQQAGGAADKHALCIQGYKAQSQIVLQYLQQLISGYEARCESAVVEGVHLSISQVAHIMQRHPCVVPFLLVIKSADKHVERMAVRAKYMTLGVVSALPVQEPGRNKYVAHMQCIRWIQEYLIKKAEQRGIPRVENTNVDRSVNLIHMTLLGVLRHVARGEAVWDASANAARLLMAEYVAAAESMANTSQGIVQLQTAPQAAATEDTAQASSFSMHSEPSGSSPAVPLPLLRLRAHQEAVASSSSGLVGSPPTPLAAFLASVTSETETVVPPQLFMPGDGTILAPSVAATSAPVAATMQATACAASVPHHDQANERSTAAVESSVGMPSQVREQLLPAQVLAAAESDTSAVVDTSMLGQNNASVTQPSAVLAAVPQVPMGVADTTEARTAVQRAGLQLASPPNSVTDAALASCGFVQQPAAPVTVAGGGMSSPTLSAQGTPAVETLLLHSNQQMELASKQGMLRQGTLPTEPQITNRMMTDQLATSLQATLQHAAMPVQGLNACDVAPWAPVVGDVAAASAAASMLKLKQQAGETMQGSDASLHVIASPCQGATLQTDQDIAAGTVAVLGESTDPPGPLQLSSALSQRQTAAVFGTTAAVACIPAVTRQQIELLVADQPDAQAAAAAPHAAAANTRQHAAAAALMVQDVHAQGVTPAGALPGLLGMPPESSSSGEEGSTVNTRSEPGGSSTARNVQPSHYHATPFANASGTPPATDVESTADLLSPLSPMLASSSALASHAARHHAQRRSAGSSVLLLAGHSSAAESDRDHLQQLDYASIYDSTAVYDDELDEMDETVTPAGHLEWGPGEQPPFYPLYTQHEGLPDTQGLTVDTKLWPATQQVDAPAGRGKAVLGRWGTRSNSTMLRHFATAIARTRQRAGQNAATGTLCAHATAATPAGNEVRHTSSAAASVPADS